MIVIALLSMVVYAARGGRRDSDMAGKGGQFLGGLGAFPLHWFAWAISPAVTVSRRLGLGPDFYNYAGLACGIASGVLIGMGRLELGGWAIVLSGIADVLDGRIARLTGTASDFGDFIDSTFDRFVESTTFLGFAFYLRPTEWGPLVAGTALAGSLIVSYTRARGEVSGVLCTKGLMQRAERMVLCALVCFLARTAGSRLGISPLSIAESALALIALATLSTAIYRTVWIGARLRGRQEAGGAGAVAVSEAGASRHEESANTR